MNTTTPVNLYIEYDICKRAPWDQYRIEPLKSEDITQELLDELSFKAESLINEGRLSFGRGETFYPITSSPYSFEVTVYLRCSINLNKE